MRRECGTCTLCCKLLPVKEIGKIANQKCQHQFSGGCRVYRDAKMPMSCRMWSCIWITGGDVGRRPDRSHYVVDMLPDFIVIKDDGVETRVPVIQVWVDPKFPDAHRDPNLRDYLAARSHEGFAALIRYSSHDAFMLFPPALTDDGQWHEVRSNAKAGPSHTMREILEAIS